MATVYLAHDLKHNRAVALKVLSRPLAAVIGAERFLREIGVASRLSHPNILPLFDSDQADGWLYYVMPYLAGGTLADRLQAQGPLAPAPALALIRQVAAALTYAHDHQVIHRDIKPGNILLVGEHAFLADFGIARTESPQERTALTEAGLILGTPGYMSPEQGQGRIDLDSRSDQYSLAAVLYECLTGVRPFFDQPGNTSPVSRLRQVPELGRGAGAAIWRALSLDREQRFESVAVFAAGLEGGATGNAAVTLRRRWVRFLVVASLVASISWAWLLSGQGAGLASRMWGGGMDSTRLAVMPFEGDSSGAGISRPMIRGALRAWEDLSLTDENRETDLLEGYRNRGLSNPQAAALARQLNAGQMLRGGVTRLGDSLRVYAALYDTRGGGVLLRSAEALLPLERGPIRDGLRTLLDRLLIAADGPDEQSENRGTGSLAATRLLVQGRRALRDWDLTHADSAFAKASRIDPGYGRAHLWLGLVRLWQRSDPALWRSAAAQAEVGQSAMTPRERRLLGALTDASQGDAGVGCAAWTRLATESPNDFLLWYGSAFCLTTDSLVLPDRGGGKKYFRSSYYAGLQSYYRAFRLAPNLLNAFRADGYAELRGLLFVSPTRVRVGYSRNGQDRFAGRPYWSGDSLAFDVIPQNALQISDSRPQRLTELALVNQREALREVTVAWNNASPNDPAALEALAVALDLTGRPSAVDTLQRAFTLLVQEPDRVRLGVTLVWMELKRAVPRDTIGMLRAWHLADSLVRRLKEIPQLDPVSGASLALLIGQPSVAARFMRQPAVARRLRMDPRLEGIGPGLLAFAAMGGPVDSLIRLEDEVRRAINGFPIMDDRSRARLEWLARSATLAFPQDTFRSIGELEKGADLLLDAQAAAARGDTRLARARLERLMGSQQPELVTIDALYPEVALLERLGDPAGSERALDRWLEALPQASTDVLMEPARAATLGRALALKARHARARRDEATAKVWDRAVGILWRDAEPFLHRAGMVSGAVAQ